MGIPIFLLGFQWIEYGGGGIVCEVEWRMWALVWTGDLKGNGWSGCSAVGEILFILGSWWDNDKYCGAGRECSVSVVVDDSLGKWEGIRGGNGLGGPGDTCGWIEYAGALIGLRVTGLGVK